MTAELTILGGGPAGLALAHYATAAGIPIALHERSNELGGLCRTFVWEGHRYDSGAHRLHDRDPEITADLRRLLGAELVRVESPSRIFERGRYIDFPPTPISLLSSISATETARVLFEVARERTRRGRRDPVSFAEYAIAQFGPTLADRLLLRYSQKIWGLPATELSVDVATRRLRGMSLATALREAIGGGRAVRHLEGAFLYPRGGYGEIARALERTVPAASIHRGRAVTRLGIERGRVVSLGFADGGTEPVAGRIVSTLPLPILTSLLGPLVPESARDAARSLRFRSLRLVVLRLGLARFSENASIYVADPHCCVSRLHEPRNRSAAMAPAGETLLVAEVPCFEGDAIDRSTDDELATRVRGELARLGLLRLDRVIGTRVHRLANAYPVYALGYGDAVATILRGLAEVPGVDTLGRGGCFSYTHLHDQLRAAKDHVALFEANRRGAA